jgi:hypothetical protein
MLSDGSGLSPTVIIAAAREILANNGFRIASESGLTALQPSRSLLAEDDYSVIALVAYDTWSELQAEWADAQAELVTLLAKRLARSAPKAWDGYLVLFCGAPTPDKGGIAAIERDTTRVRKIVATGEALKTTTDISRVLDPFLPLARPGTGAEIPDVLATLPELLKTEVPIAATEAVVNAFRAMEPPLERLHELGGVSHEA